MLEQELTMKMKKFKAET